MSPRSLSPQVVLQKARQMARLLDVLDGLGEVSRARIEQDPILRLALERVVTQLVDLAIDVNMHVVVGGAVGSLVPADGKESFLKAAELGLIDEELADQLAQSVGLRNVIVHDYLALDEDIFVRSIPVARQQFRGYVRHVAAWVERA